MTLSSRERLVEAAERLFAERGFAATSVGDIEEAAGFVRRGGTAYKHFASKTEILDAVLDHHAELARSAKKVGELFPLDDRRSELTLLGRLVLRALDDQENLHRLLERDGERLSGSRDRLARAILHEGYRPIIDLFRRWIPRATDADLDALVVVLLGGLVNLRRNLWTFGTTPLEVGEEEALESWVTIAEATLESLEVSKGPEVQ